MIQCHEALASIAALAALKTLYFAGSFGNNGCVLQCVVQCVAVCCTTCYALCCSVLQRLAACCSVLQCQKALASIVTLTALKILDIAGRFGECVLQCVVHVVAVCCTMC